MRFLYPDRKIAELNRDGAYLNSRLYQRDYIHIPDSVGVAALGGKWRDNTTWERDDVYVVRGNKIGSGVGYIGEIRKYLGLGWFLSFIPGTNAFASRLRLAKAVSQWEGEFKQHYCIDNKGEILKYSRGFEILQKFPSKNRIAFFIGLTIVLLLLAATGIGGLISVGALGTAFSTTVVGKSLLGLFLVVSENIAIFTSLNTVALGLITGISAWLATVSFMEVLEPGTIVKMWPGNRQRVTSAMKTDWVEIVILHLPMVSDILKYRYYSRRRKTTLLDLKNLVKNILNPFCWALKMLDMVELLVNRLIEIGDNEEFFSRSPKSSFIRQIAKGAFHLFVYEPIRIPLAFFESILSVPITMLFTLIIQFPKNIYEACQQCANVSSHDLDSLQNASEQKEQRINVIGNSDSYTVASSQTSSQSDVTEGTERADEKASVTFANGFKRQQLQSSLPAKEAGTDDESLVGKNIDPWSMNMQIKE